MSSGQRSALDGGRAETSGKLLPCGCHPQMHRCSLCKFLLSYAFPCNEHASFCIDLHKTSGPSLLTGLAVCASCGSGMTQTGTTNRQGRSYSYYSCAGCQQKGKTVCKGRHIPAAVLDEIVLTNLKLRILVSDRIANLLRSLVERQAARSESVDRRLLTLQREVSDAEDRLNLTESEGRGHRRRESTI